MLTRRKILGSLAATPFALSTPAFAGLLTPRSEQNGAWTKFNLGDFEITVVSDGHFTTPTELFGEDVDRAEVQDFLKQRFLDPDTHYQHTNHVVIDTGDAKVLVDVGSGERLFFTAGKLRDNLEAAGIAADDITHVALTHAHPDHVWGMFDDFDEPRFPEADYTIGAAEFDWWMADGRSSDVPPEQEGDVIGAQKALGPMADRTTMVASGADVVSGVRLIETPGHTIGHMSVEVESNGEGLLVLGDALTHAHVSFEHPKWEFGRDYDKAQAAATRVALLDRAATDQTPVLGYHLPFPGIGHVVRDGDAFRFLPALVKWIE